MHLGTLASLSKSLRRIAGKFNVRWSSDFFHKSSPVQAEDKKPCPKVPLPPEPTSCCMSGCSDCVWIKYAQELAQMFDDGDEIARNKIMEKVSDPGHRAFLFERLGLKESEK